MTNEELNIKFREITLLNNDIFSRYCALGNVEEDYKTTEFAEQTKYTIQEAYELYLKHQGVMDTVLGLFTNPNLDLDAFKENLTGIAKAISNAKIEIPEEYKGIYKELLKEGVE